MENLTREQKIELLKLDYENNYSNNGYKAEFKEDGYLTECNFGGLLVIMGRTGESVLVWRDWADAAIDTKLTECEIVNEVNEDTNETEAGFFHNGNFIYLSHIMAAN